MARRNEAELTRMVDELGTMLADAGLPPVAGRLLGWLLVCDPPEQSTSQLRKALHTSNASISQAGRLLVRVGIADRVHVRGAREVHYRMRPNAWSALFEAKIAAMTQIRELAARGLKHAGDAPRQRDRLRELHDLYAFVEDEFRSIMLRWNKRRSDQR